MTRAEQGLRGGWRWLLAKTLRPRQWTRRHSDRLTEFYRRRNAEISIAYGAVLLTMSTVLVIIGVAILQQGNDVKQVVADVQTSRYEATLRSCLSRTRDRAQIVTFVALLAPRLAERAAEQFPPIAAGRRYGGSCVRYARLTTVVR